MKKNLPFDFIDINVSSEKTFSFTEGKIDMDDNILGKNIKYLINDSIENIPLSHLNQWLNCYRDFHNTLSNLDEFKIIKEWENGFDNHILNF